MIEQRRRDCRLCPTFFAFEVIYLALEEELFQVWIIGNVYTAKNKGTLFSDTFWAFNLNRPSHCHFSSPFPIYVIIDPNVTQVFIFSKVKI